MDKEISSILETEYEPDLPWNKWKKLPKGKDPGEERPKNERLSVVIKWPTIEDGSRYAESGSTTAISFAYVKNCVKEIKNPEVAGISATNGKELVETPAHNSRKPWQLALNVGTYIFTGSFLTEEEEKN